jgi:hypothetical protein
MQRLLATPAPLAGAQAAVGPVRKPQGRENAEATLHPAAGGTE